MHHFQIPFQSLQFIRYLHLLYLRFQGFSPVLLPFPYPAVEPYYFFPGEGDIGFLYILVRFREFGEMNVLSG